MGVKVTVKQQIIDRGWNNIQKELKYAKNSFSKVGLPERAPVKTGDAGKDTINTMSELVRVGAVHEFGAPNKNIPERSFMRAGFDKSRKELLDMSLKLYDKILAGTMSTKFTLQLLGLKHVDQIKSFITDLRRPVNAPSTIRQKGSSNPLIDSAQMRNSIQHEVVVNE